MSNIKVKSIILELVVMGLIKESDLKQYGLQDLRRSYEPQMSISAEKGSNIVAMSVVEDFIYLNRSSSTSTIQVYMVVYHLPFIKMILDS